MLDCFRILDVTDGSKKSGFDHFVSGSHSSMIESQELFLFKTCVRSLVFDCDLENKFLGADLSGVVNGATVLSGQEAYRHVLEVVCGYLSPVFGETEVQGQFKIFAESVYESEKRGSDRAARLAKVLRNIQADAKSVREQWLRELGAQSYGSWVRDYVRRTPVDSISIWGFGNLAQNIYPWISNVVTQISVRDVTKAKNQLSRINPKFRGQVLDSFPTTSKKKDSLLLIAAPLTISGEQWIRINENFSVVLDLRAENEVSDRINGVSENAAHWISLSEVFKDFKELEYERLQTKLEVAAAIRRLSHHRFFSAQYRPMGWDDICA